MFKEPYELSIWEDILIPATDTMPEYFDERRIQVISADNLDLPGNAYNVNLRKSINGDKTLTFSMLRKFRNENDELIDNPLIQKLTNEQKIKLREGEEYTFSEVEELEEEDIDERWSEFVIKHIDEDKTSYVNTYTAKELFINELGKNGWSVTLATQLENNFGTVKELGNAVLEGSDWEVSDSSYSPIEKIAEPLFQTTLASDLEGVYTLSKEPVTIPSGHTIYPLYDSVEWNSIANKWEFKLGEVQFLYSGRNFTLGDVDDDRIVIDDYSTFNITTTEVLDIIGDAPFLTGTNQTDAIQGRRVVKSPNRRYERVLNKYVTEFDIVGDTPAEIAANREAVGAIEGVDEVFGYTNTQYISPTIIENYLTNSKNFVSTNAWGGDTASTRLFPEPSVGMPVDWVEETIFNYLALNFSSAREYYNEGPYYAGLSLVKDNIYVLRIKARWIDKNHSEGSLHISGSNRATVQAVITREGSSELLTNTRTITTSTLNTVENSEIKGYPLANLGERTGYSSDNGTTVYRDHEQYAYVYFKANRSTNPQRDVLRLKLKNTTNNSTYDYCIEDIQLFDYHEDELGHPIFINDLLEARIQETPMFYQVQNREVTFLSSDSSYYEMIYKEGFESVRNVHIQESNYFNNIQSLAELFEVWVRFKVYHKKNGKLLLNTEGRPKKEVVFSRYAPGGDGVNQAGFKYGINLESMRRNIDSSALATKVIVQNNNQELATDGTASISRAHSNPSGENEIFNFNYYVNKGMLDYDQVWADLYNVGTSSLAYLARMKELNNAYVSKSNILNIYQNELSINRANLSLNRTQISSADEEIAYYTQLMAAYRPGDVNYNSAKAAAERLVSQRQAYIVARDEAEANVDYYQELYDTEAEVVDGILNNKKELNLKFYQKYYRFIQEGTWIDEKYIDDELYYLDAVKVSDVSAFPKVSYSIGVLDIDKTEGYEGYSYEVGERSYVEDPEFFGYVYKSLPGVENNIKTPYRQEVVIAETYKNFNDPSQSTILVQNYKSQFQELFQKVAATTQTLQYASGTYARAAEAVTPSREINISFLEESFANNAFIISNTQNEDISWDSTTGIQLTNKDNRLERTRLMSGGIFLTRDGGNVWETGITPQGINVRLLTAGEINTARITLVNGGIPSFRWDQDGLNAFRTTDVVGGNYDLTSFVRFSEYGLFGVDSTNNNSTNLTNILNSEQGFNVKLDAINQYSNFALNWEGLRIKYGKFLIGNSPTDYKLYFDGDNLLLGNDVEISWENLSEETKENLKGEPGRPLDITSQTTLPNGNIRLVLSDGTTVDIPKGNEGDSITIVSQTTDSNGNTVVTFSDGTVTTIPKGDRGDQGPRGLQGIQGARGDQGIQGVKGIDGQTQYTHIAYGTSSSGADFSHSSFSEATYIGMYVDFTETSSSTPSQYEWTLIKGADGTQGIQGPKGLDGLTPYFHTAWANNATGSSGFSTTESADKLYLGTYTDYIAADSQEPNKYDWVRIKGEDAEPLPSYITATKITKTTIESPTITAGTLTGSTINNGNGTFTVNSVGEMTATSGEIGGWDIGRYGLYNDTVEAGFLTTTAVPVKFYVGGFTYNEIINQTGGWVEPYFWVDGGGNLTANNVLANGDTTISKGMTIFGDTGSGTLDFPAGRKVEYIRNYDCNNILNEWVLGTNGSNFPDSGYWYVNTLLYFSSEQRLQLAYSYTGTPTMYMRTCYYGAWTSWVKIG